MSSTNGGPSVTTTPNVVVQAVPAGSSSVPFDPSSVAITGGTINSVDVLNLAGEGAYLFRDDFSRYSNGALAGRSPLIGSFPWQVSGAGVAGERILSGTWSSTGSGATYAVGHLDATPWEIGQVFTSLDGVAFTPLVACVKDYANHALSAMWHSLVVTSTPSASFIKPSYWNDTWNGSGSTVADVAPAFIAPAGSFALLANTKYRYRIIFNAPYVDYVIEKYSDNSIIAASRSYDPLVSSLIGPWLFIETFSPNFVIHEVYARSKPTTDTLKNKKVLTGLEATPIGMSAPAAANFNNVHVGFGQPKGVSSIRYDGTATAAPGAYSTGNALWKVMSETPGFTAGIELTAGAGYVGSIVMDGAAAMNFTGQSGTTFLTKPANAGTPYFAAGVGIGGSAGPLILAGTGTPEGAVTAPIGSSFSRTDGTTGTARYLKETGAGNTGWVAK